MAGMMFNCATAWAFETGAGANALVYQYAAATVTSPITNSAQVKNATGHRDIRSLVGVQLKCALPLRLPAFGNNGDGRTILPASRILLSQKMSSVFVPAIDAGRGFFALPSAGGA